MNNFTALASGIVALLFALFINRILINRRHPLLGYGIGLIPFYAAWQLFMLQLPSSEYCRQNPLTCEWTGMGALFFTGYIILLALVYSALSITMNAYYHHVAFQSVQVGGNKARITSKLGIISLLLITTVLGGLLTFAMINLVMRGVFIGWYNLGNPLVSGRAVRLEGESSRRIYSYNLEEIYIETNKGRIFQADVDLCITGNSSQRQDCWFLSMPVELYKSEFMACEQKFWIRNPPCDITEQVQTRLCDDISINQTNYLLSTDGDVWMWHYGVSTNAMIISIAVIGGAILGLFIASILLRFVYLRAQISRISR
jgi:hypothetical protein